MSDIIDSNVPSFRRQVTPDHCVVRKLETETTSLAQLRVDEGDLPENWRDNC